MRGVEESFAVRLWILSGGCWAGCHPPHHRPGSAMVACPKKFGEEICAFPKRKGRAGACAQARHLGAHLCLSGQDSTRNKAGSPGWGVWLPATHLQVLWCQSELLGERLLIKGDSVIFTCYTACSATRRQALTLLLRLPLLFCTLPHAIPTPPLQADTRGSLH